MTSSAVKFPQLEVDVSPVPWMAAPVPPADPTVCEAFGTCRKPRERLDTPHVIIVWFSGLYELAGQSISSNGVVTCCVVSYGS